jgi:succinate dehydrogenase/fumarate reductase flavoprotein subunit
LAGSAVGIMATAGASLMGCSTSDAPEEVANSQISWDKEADVVIMGYGYAGACAAISAQDAGASVIIAEKAPQGGGSSADAVGMMHTTFKVDDKEAWIKSRVEQLLGTVPENVTRAFVEYELTMPEWLEENLGMEINWLNGGARATMAQYLTGSGPGNGKDLWEFFSDHAEERGAEVLLSTRVKKLIQAEGSNEVLGLVAEQDGKELTIKANKGVVMACGGYENNQSMQAQYHYPGIPFVPWGTPYNTGDGIGIAQKAGADMWHFSCFEYAGLAPKKPYEEMEGNPVFTLDYNCTNFYTQDKAGNFIIVNKAGKRFFDENVGISHQKTTLPFNYYNEHDEEYVNYPFYFICDASRIASGPLAPTPLFGVLPFTHSGHFSNYEWSVDNSAEIEKGWIVEADTIEGLAEKLGIDPSGLSASISAFNGYASTGVDSEFARSAESMAPLGTPPFYAVDCLLSIINTMGGPVRNERSQVLDIDGNPIPRLYSAGEFGSLNGGILYSIGNIAEAIASGRRAGDEAAAQ